MADKSGIPGRRNKGGKRLAPPQRRHGLDIGGKAERGSHKRLAQPQPKQERRESHKRLAQPQREHKESAWKKTVSAWKKTFSEWKKAVSAWGARVRHTCRECREKAGKAVGAWRERLKRSPQAERRYNPWVWLATLFLGPLAILLCVQTITFASLFKAFSWVFGHLGAAVLCYLALLSAMIIILALIWKIWSAFLILAIPAVALAVVNRMKLSLNGTPLLLSDFSLASKAGDVAGYVAGKPMVCTIGGTLRGLLADGVPVTKGMKSGDVDPRCEEAHCRCASDKALAVGGGVLEAALRLSGALKPRN